MTVRALRGRADLARSLENREQVDQDRLASLFGYERRDHDREKPDPSLGGNTGTAIGAPKEAPRPRIEHRALQQLPFLVPNRYTACDPEEGVPADPDETTIEPVIWHTKPMQTPPWPSLRPGRSLIPMLRRLLAPPDRGWEVDVPRTVEHLAKGGVLIDPPRRRRRTWARTIMVVIDRNPQLIPLWADQTALVPAIAHLAPNSSVMRVQPGANADDFWIDHGDGLERAVPTRDGTLWLVLGDLGALTGAGVDRWLKLGRNLDPGCAIALTPTGPEAIDPRVRSLWRIEPWEAPTPHAPKDTGERRALARKLLTLLSPAIGFTPGLLRALRRDCLPDADIAVEIAAWNDPAIETRSSVMTAFTQEAAKELRAAFESASLREPTDETDDGTDTDGNPPLTRLECEKALEVIWRWRTGGPLARVAEDFWFTEILNLSPSSQALIPDPGDVETAHAYFADLDRRRQGHGEALALGTRAWLSQMGDRAPRAFRQDAAFRSVVWSIKASEPGFTPPPGVDLPTVDGLSIGRMVVTQAGDDLVISADGAATGSPIALLPSDNGVIDILDAGTDGGDDGWSEIWGPVGVPDWVDDYGIDRYGRWCRFSYGDVSQTLRWCPPGRFVMGSPEDEPGRWDDEGPQVEITVAEGFWLFDTPVTQALYQAVTGKNPSRFQSPERPVETVSWEDAQAFLKRLNSSLPELDLRLPSEAQWEYACRADTVEATYAGPIKILGERNAPILDDIAWYGGNSGVGFDLEQGYDNSDWEEKQYDHSRAGTRIVKGKRPNPWGLYDMIGNVWEWCDDVWNASHEGADVNGRPRPRLESEGSGERDRVVRGGSWSNSARNCRAAYRGRNAPDFRYYDLGFRPARGPARGPAGGPEGPGRGSVKASRPEALAARDTGRRAEHGRDFWVEPKRRKVSHGHPAKVEGLNTLQRPYILRTDRAELRVARQTLTDLSWARTAGRDRFGLWADLEHKDVVQRLRWCPPGRFVMGSPEDEPGRDDDEGPPTEITFAEGFWVFDTPVTQALYQAVMDKNPSQFKTADRPVDTVSWEDAKAFLDRLNKDRPGLNLRLPSEAQWEYACRAGTTAATYAGPIDIVGENNAPILDAIAWYGGNSGVDYDLEEGHDSSRWSEKQYDHSEAGTRIVKGKRPNPWGLYDMIGNVWEWCEDVWNASHEGADLNGLPRPRLESEGNGKRSRVVRGGSWFNVARRCRAAYRSRDAPDDRDDDLGFRPAGGPEGPGRGSSKATRNAIDEQSLGTSGVPDNRSHSKLDTVESRGHAMPDGITTRLSAEPLAARDAGRRAKRGSILRDPNDSSDSLV